MGKSIYISIVLFLNVICTNITHANDCTDVLTYEQKAELAVIAAEKYVGIREKGGNNQGYTDAKFEALMKEMGWKKGQSWCAYFLKAVYKIAGIVNSITAWSPSSYNKKHVIFTDGKLLEEIKQGDSMSLSYNKFKNDKTRYKGIGHTGIVYSKYGKNAVVTIEGNASEVTDTNDGGGVVKKIRPLQSNLHITRWDK